VIPVKLDVREPAIVKAAALRCNDVTLLVNNAGIARVDAGALDPAVIDHAHETFETNFYEVIRTSQAFAPVLSANGGGAIINVLSEVTWFSRPLLSAYAASKSAAWSFTNALRDEVRDKGIQVLALHVGFVDTDFTKAFDVKKSDPREIVARTLDALEEEQEEVLADAQTEALKRSLSTAKPYYLNTPPLDHLMASRQGRPPESQRDRASPDRPKLLDPASYISCSIGARWVSFKRAFVKFKNNT
jgi:short-subunit dehydrogenase